MQLIHTIMCNLLYCIITASKKAFGRRHMFPLRPFGPKLGNISRFFYAASCLAKTFRKHWGNYGIKTPN